MTEEERKLVGNERTKLLATYLNGVAIATLAIGGVAPLASLVSGVSSASALTVFAMVTVSAAMSVGAHLSGRWVLGRLQ